MTKMERLTAALRGDKADRTPFSVYLHSVVRDRTIDRFVAFTLDFHRRYDPDYLKVMFDDHYDLPPTYDFIRSVEVWRELEEFEPTVGAFGRVLEALKRIKGAVGPEVPVIQTLYLPFHFGQRLAYRRILEDFRRDPNAVRAGLEVIARNTVSFGRACLAEAGIDGFFFGAYGCDASWMTEEFYRESIKPLDLAVIEPLARAPVTILHIHGERGVFFDMLKDYPVKALSWEDRTAGPSLEEARSRTDKCLVGGIDHLKARTRPPSEIIREGQDAIAVLDGRGLVLAPGCTLKPDTPPENVRAVGRAASGDGR